jgi:rhamnogalacturonyl hydrolase YesR
MFLYLLQKSIDKGYISKPEYQSVADKAYNGLIKKVLQNKQGYTDLIECSSIGIQNSYTDYIRQPKEISTFAAFGSFIIGTGIFENR